MSEQTTYDKLSEPFGEVFEDTRGGVHLTYITGEQCLTRLNTVLGPGGWSFKVVEHGYNQEADEVWALGALTATIDGELVERQQFGSQKIKRSRATEQPLDIGFDLKGATTDALKKCASMIGIGLYLSHKEGTAGGRGDGAAPAAKAPELTGPTCLCGEPRVFKTGQNARGEWRAWMCPKPRDKGCGRSATIFLRDDDPDPRDRPATEAAAAQLQRDLDAIPFEPAPAGATGAADVTTANGQHVLDQATADAVAAGLLDICAECNAELKDVRFKDGTTWTAHDLATRGQRKFGRVLCMHHYREASAARTSDPGQTGAQSAQDGQSGAPASELHQPPPAPAAGPGGPQGTRNYRGHLTSIDDPLWREYTELALAAQRAKLAFTPHFMPTAQRPQDPATLQAAIHRLREQVESEAASGAQSR